MTMHGPQSKTPAKRPDRRSGMRSMMTRAFGWAAACALALTPDPVMAATDTAADVARLQNEVERLKQELADQRQLILQLMQAEQQRYDVVLKMLRAGGGAGADLPALPPPPSPSAMMPRNAAGAGDAGKDGGVSGHESATVTGKVRSSGGAIGEAYVY